MAAVLTTDAPVTQRWYRRHAGLIRVTHWINAFCFMFLLMSGLQIFNAHPALYIGNSSDFGHSLLSFRAFPSWITLPSYQDLATARRWHFFFAWVLVLNGLFYLAWGFASRHFGRDLLPSRAGLSRIGREVIEHLHLRFPRGEAARRYNVLQQLTYLLVVFGLFPLVILTGLTMSPGIDSLVPQLLTLFGGRQTARLIHFAAAWSLVLFVVVHLVLVLVSGVWNNLRSMVTGWYNLGNRRETHVR
jgi:thiosulfate reductase cytochrome b subunit